MYEGSALLTLETTVQTQSASVKQYMMVSAVAVVALAYVPVVVFSGISDI
jgi:hypothetical protein